MPNSQQRDFSPVNDNPAAQAFRARAGKTIIDETGWNKNRRPYRAPGEEQLRMGNLNPSPPQMT